jgi:monoamine oxidase
MAAMNQSFHKTRRAGPAKLGRRRFLKAAFGAASMLPLRAMAGQNLRSPPPETVLVIGAGLAGLAAALRLREARKQVIVVEARNAPGGRVRTLRNIADGLYAELGAARVADTHEYVLHWLNDFNLSLTPFSPATANVLAMSGRHARSDDEAERARMAPGLSPEERRLSPSALLLKYVEGLPDELSLPEIDLKAPVFAPFDRVTWPAFLKMRGASDAAVKTMSLGGDSSPLSALFMLRQIMLIKDSRGYLKIEGGMDVLPRAIAKNLGSAIRYNCEVVRIERSGLGVRAVCRQGDRNETIMADRAVIAIPFPALKRVALDEPFSALKSEAIANLTYYEATRFLIETKTRFWERQKLSGSARTDGPGDIWDGSFGQKGRTGILSLTTGGHAIETRLAGLSEEARRSLGASLTEAAFPEVKDQLHAVHIQRWVEEPFARGAFSMFGPGEMTRWTEAMLKPEGRVHFAGEHLSPWSGWMEGALWSGDRVAQEIVQQ